MCNIKDQIVTLLKQRHHSHKVALEQEKDPRSKHAVDLIARIREDSRLIEVIDSLPEEKQPEDLEGKQMIKELKERIVGLDNNGNPIAAAPPDIPMIVEKVNEIIRCLNATQRK